MEALPSSDVLDSLSESEPEQGSVVAMVTESSSPYCETAGIVGGGILSVAHGAGCSGLGIV